MTQVTKEEFDAHVSALDAIPDGFRPNVGSNSRSDSTGRPQSRFYSRAQEVGRVTYDGAEAIYEIQGFHCPLCEEDFGHDAIHNDDGQMVCPHCGEVVE